MPEKIPFALVLQLDYIPVVGRPSKYLHDVSFTVFRLNSADVPPTTSAKWYGGHAAVPSVCYETHV